MKKSGKLKSSHRDTKTRSSAGTQNNTPPKQNSVKLALERRCETSSNAPCPRASVRVNKNKIECFHGDTEAQRVPVKTSAPPRPREKNKMKDSGIPWIGNIPEDWEVDKIIRCFGEIGSGTTPKSLGTVSGDSDINWIQSGDINGSVLSETNFQVSKETVEKTGAIKVYGAPFIVIAMYGASIGNLSISQIDACTNQACCVLSLPRKDLSLGYLFYALKPAKDYLIWKADGGGQPNISQDKVKGLWVPVPPTGTQKRIAEFLDKKCAEIDALISLQEKMIAELKSYKQSVITEAVTRGVPAKNQNKGSHGDTKTRSVAGTQNDTFPNQKSAELALERQRKTSLNSPCPRASVRDKMKDSGIPWLGSVPAHWEVKRLKFSCSIQGRIGFRGYTSDDLVSEGEGAITLSPSNMKDMKMDFNKRTYLSWAKYYESPEIMIVPGDILFVKTGSTYGKCSFVDFVPMECTINPQIVVFKSHKDNPKFLSYYFQTPIANAFVETSVVGGTIPTISQEKIINYAFAIPPMDEQREITEYLDEKCSEIDTMISLKQQKIATLQNYKKSVIFEYVTGKKII